MLFIQLGNEIQEAGTKQGAWINRILCNKFHELDNTRYTTNALNGLNCAGRRLGFIMRDVAGKNLEWIHMEVEAEEEAMP